MKFALKFEWCMSVCYLYNVPAWIKCHTPGRFPFFYPKFIEPIKKQPSIDIMVHDESNF